MPKLPENLAATGELSLMVIKRRDGRLVELKVVSVDRQKWEVVIDIPEYNSRFTFSDVTGKIALTQNGRQKIDENLSATTHISQSVYAGLARWAGSILNDRRR